MQQQPPPPPGQGPPPPPYAPPQQYQGQQPYPGQQYPGQQPYPAQQPIYYGAPLPPVLQGRQLAGPGERFLAALLDGLINLVLAITIVGPPLYMTLTTARQGEANGQTLGKQALAIRAVREDGQPFDVGSAAMREVVIMGLLFGTGGYLLFGLLSVNILTGGILGLIGALWMLWDARKQCLWDKLAQTYVVKG